MSVGRAARRFGRKLRPRARHDESGFTLAELILAITIETIIFGALAAAFVVVLNGGSSVNQSLSKSSDARYAANYMISDARNSSGPETSLTDTTSCADPNPPVTGAQTAVARFSWNAPNEIGTTTANISNYVLVSGALLRRHCEGGALVSDAALATSIASVTVSCSPIADCTGAPTSITVVITESPDTGNTIPGATAYSYSLTAAFRKLESGGTSLTPSPPQSLVLFGNGGCGINISGGPTGGLTVYGNAFINTADSGSCHALDLSGSAFYSAGSTSILTGGTCVFSGGGSPCPAPNPYSPAKTDPYSGLTPPSGGTARTNACGGTSGTFTALPGVYSTAFVVQGSTDCTLATGTYIFQAGFSVTAGATLHTATGGVLLYLTGGTFNIDGAGNVTLAALTGTTYSGLVVWQAAADTSTVNLAAGGVVTFSGGLYAPRAELLISGNAQGTKITSIVALNMIINGSAGLVIGASPTPLAITGPATLPAWTINRPYPSTTITPSGGDGSYTWSATGLPNGMSINTSTGIISGTPTVAGAASVVVTLNDALGEPADTASYTLTINPRPTVATTSLPVGEKTVAYSTTLAGATGTAPYTWAAIANLPAGLTLNTGTGVISGTPTAVVAPSLILTLTDAAGATATRNVTLTVNAPPTISSVTLANHTGTAGTIDAGDTVTVVFSAQMDVSDFCSTWTSDSSDQVLNGLSDVTVSVSNGNPDVLSVASLTCTFNFGLLNFASNSYVTAAATFKGSTTTTRSTIAWTTATHTLVVTLGAKTAGTLANVSTSTPIYTAPTTLSDTAGGLLSNSPFTLPAGNKF